MKKQEIKKLRAKSRAELEQELEGKTKELIESKFALTRGKLDDVHLPYKLKKEIAVIKTIITEKSIAANQSREESK